MTEESRDDRREQLRWLADRGVPEARQELDAMQDEVAAEWSSIIDRAPEFRDMALPVQLVTTSSPDLSERLRVAHRWHVDWTTGVVTHIS